jgi:hypothetical protein
MSLLKWLPKDSHEKRYGRIALEVLTVDQRRMLKVGGIPNFSSKNNKLTNAKEFKYPRILSRIFHGCWSIFQKEANSGKNFRLVNKIYFF